MAVQLKRVNDEKYDVELDGVVIGQVRRARWSRYGPGWLHSKRPHAWCRTRAIAVSRLVAAYREKSSG